MSGIIVLLNIKHWIKISRILVSNDWSFGYFEENVSVIKLSVSIFVQTTGYRLYSVSREPIRLPEIQHLVFGILLFKNIEHYILSANWGVLKVFDTEFSPTQAYEVTHREVVSSVAPLYSFKS